MGYERELAAARGAARQAAELAMGYWRSGVQPEDKPDDSPVTVADRESEKLFVKLLGEAFPGDGFLGEEGSTVAGTSGRRWIIDPIDGTRDFVRGNRLWSNLLGLEEGGQVVLGVATFPALGEQYWAVRGGGAWKSADGVESRMRCSTITETRRAVVCFNQLNRVLAHPRSEKVLPFLEQFGASRCLGGAWDAMLVSDGSAEVWLEPVLKPWDLAALSVIAKEAGCAYFDYQGEDTIYSGNGVICVPGMVPVMRAFLGLSS